MSDLEVVVDEARLEVSFRLVGALDDELIERIEAGLPSGFVYQFKLVRPTRYWLNNTLRTSQLEVVASYNAVTHEYLVNYSHNGKLTESRAVMDHEELEAAMTRFERLAPIDLEGLAGHKPVYIRVRAEIGSKNLLRLIPTTIHTEWLQSERFTLPEVVED